VVCPTAICSLSEKKGLKFPIRKLFLPSLGNNLIFLSVRPRSRLGTFSLPCRSTEGLLPCNAKITNHGVTHSASGAVHPVSASAMRPRRVLEPVWFSAGRPPLPPIPTQQATWRTCPLRFRVALFSADFLFENNLVFFFRC
jgi:hypothetical protein